MMLFTDFLPDPETQSQIGYSIIVIIVVGTLINMTMLFITPIKRLTTFCRIRKGLKAAKKEKDLKKLARAAKTFPLRRAKKFNAEHEKVRLMIVELN